MAKKKTQAPTQKGWIGVDLDGTLAEYNRWLGHSHIGEPIRAMVERVKKWHSMGYETRILTARMDGIGMRPSVVSAIINEWLVNEAGLPPMICTNAKDMHMLFLVDDNAVQVEANTGELIGYIPRPGFADEG